MFILFYKIYKNSILATFVSIFASGMMTCGVLMGIIVLVGREDFSVIPVALVVTAFGFVLSKIAAKIAENKQKKLASKQQFSPSSMYAPLSSQHAQQRTIYTPPVYTPQAAKAASQRQTFTPPVYTPPANNSIYQLYSNAQILHNNGEYHKEIDLLRNGVNLAGHEANYWSKLGLAYKYAGNTESALNCYDHAVQLAPNDGVIYMNYGALYYSTGNNLKAIQYYEQALTKSFSSENEYAVLLANYAMAIYKTGDRNRALFYIDEAEKRGYPNGNTVRSMMNQ